MAGGRPAALATCCLSSLLLVHGIYFGSPEGHGQLRLTVAHAGAGGACIGARRAKPHTQDGPAQLENTLRGTGSAPPRTLRLRGGKGTHVKSAKKGQVSEKTGKGSDDGVQGVPGTTAVTAAAVLFYLATSLSLTLMNKGLFAHFHFPVFVTEFQLCVAALLLLALGELGAASPLFAFAPPMRLEWRTASQVAPCVVLFGAMLALTNHCLRHVHLTFYQVVRALVIPISIAASFILNRTLPSYNSALCCVVVTVGFAMGSFAELDFSHAGLVYGVLSALAAALYSIAVKHALPHVGGDTWRLMHYTSTGAALLLAPTLLLTREWAGAAASGHLASPLFWAAMTTAAVAGFMINVAYFALIKFGTALSVHVAGCAKSALQTLLGVLIFRNKVTWVNWAGVGLTLLGSALFSVEGYMERRRQQQQRPPPPDPRPRPRKPDALPAPAPRTRP